MAIVKTMSMKGPAGWCRGLRELREAGRAGTYECKLVIARYNKSEGKACRVNVFARIVGEGEGEYELNDRMADREMEASPVGRGSHVVDSL